MSAQHPHSGAWNSKYRHEIQNINIKCNVGFVLKDGHSPKKNVELAVDKYSHQKMSSGLAEHRAHSLRYFPDYPDDMGRQKYINFSDSSSTLTKFRLGNANLGDKETPAILICPSCQVGPNNELHLVFECNAMSNLRSDHWMQSVLNKQEAQTAQTLRDRGAFLSILRQKHLELKEA